MDTKIFLVYLHSLGFSQRSLVKIFEKEQNYEGFYRRLDAGLLKRLGLRDEKIALVLEKKSQLDEAKIADLLASLQVTLVTIHDPEYPKLLRETKICPYFLYVRGTLSGDRMYLSVVGSRKSTPYSKASLEGIIPTLVTAEYGIVSGGAYGVDALAHTVTMDTGGYTVAVFGTGIDGCYPAKNRDLFDRILASGGALVSAFPLGMGPDGFNFPIRNEIVASMSRWVLVTEAGERSGTLITAGLALDFGRDVFALPGDITRTTSRGANELIRDWQAKLILSGEDILNEYRSVEVAQRSLFTTPSVSLIFDDATEERIYELLKAESLDPSSIADHLALDATTVAFKLSMMEVNGLIEMSIGGGYEAK